VSTPSTAYTESTASTHDCRSSLYSHDYKLTPEYSFSFQRASIQDHQPALHESSKVNIPRPHSHSCELTNWGIESQHPVRLHWTASHQPPPINPLPSTPSHQPPPINHLPSAGCKYSFNLARSWPPSASPNSLDRGLQVHLPNSLDDVVQVHLQTYSITLSKCISKLARLHRPSASPNSLDYGLQVHLWVHSTLASQCISKLARSWPPSSNDHDLQVHPQTHSISASKWL